MPAEKAEGQTHREQARKRSRARTAAANDIGTMPRVANPKRKAACRKSLLLFSVSYFPGSAGLKPMGQCQREMYERLQFAVLNYARIIDIMPRGYAKTTASEIAALWATLYGYRKFVPIFAEGSGAALQIIESIKMELMTNDLLYADFPEVCFPLREIDWKPQRCVGQMYRKKHTFVDWTSLDVVLPTIPKSAASGAILSSHGLESATRGMKRKTPGGANQRPDFFIIDDPQTDESAGSKVQIQARLRIIKKSICRGGGHFKAASGVVNATQICPGDLVAELADPIKNPSWQVTRARMVPQLSDHHDTLWLGAYKKIRNTFNRDEPDDQQRARREATEFYRARMADCKLSMESARSCAACPRQAVCMDAGCVVSWQHCYSELDGEISAVQHAYNILIDEGQEVFDSECQSDPKESYGGKKAKLTADHVLTKCNGLARGCVPKSAQHVTAYIDVHERVLYWTAVGWSEGYGGAVADYGVYPEQPVRYFAQATAPVAMADVHPGMDEDAWIQAGLKRLTDRILAAVFTREDGAPLKVGKLLIDGKWGEKTDLVKSFCRRHPQAGVVMAAMGVGLGPTRKALTDYRPEPGAQTGFHCRIPPPVKGDRIVMIDTNRMKSFALSRLAVALATPGGWELFGDGRDPGAHKLLADHYTSERPKEVKETETGITVDQWVLVPNRDNHWWDCLCGAAAAASLLGIRPEGMGRKASKGGKSLAAMWGRK